jgi:hypothetical protein
LPSILKRLEKEEEADSKGVNIPVSSFIGGSRWFKLLKDDKGYTLQSKWL